MKTLTKLAGALVLLAIHQFANAIIINESDYNNDFSNSTSAPTLIGSYSSSTTTINGYLDANGSGSDEWDIIGFTTDDSWYLSLNFQNLGNSFGLFAYTTVGGLGSDNLLNLGDLSQTRSAGTYWLGLTGVANTGTGTYSFDLIVGDGISSTVPEPSIITLLSLGLFGMAWSRRKIKS